MSSEESDSEENSSFEYDDGYGLQNRRFGGKTQKRKQQFEETHVPTKPLPGNKDITWSKVRAKLGRVKTLAAKFLHNRTEAYLKEQYNGYQQTRIQPPEFSVRHLLKKMTSSSYRIPDADITALDNFLKEMG